jgi:hypothetical protein
MGTTFTLHTRGNHSLPMLMAATDDPDLWHTSLYYSAFSAAKETKFITHGFQDTGADPWVVEMMQELLKHVSQFGEV